MKPRINLYLVNAPVQAFQTHASCCTSILQ